MKQLFTLLCLACFVWEARAQTKFLQQGFGSGISSSHSDKLVALHRTYPTGTRLLVKNTANESTVVVKVIGTIPNTAENEKIVIKLSQAACKALHTAGKKFSVQIFTAPPEGAEPSMPKDTTRKKTPKDKEVDKEPDLKEGEILHKVAVGETLYAIAKKYKVTVEKIMEWNKLENTTLYKGQKLKIVKF